jgi:type IV pilus assembly protein PilV
MLKRRKTASCATGRAQAGFSMIEVLVAILLTAVGLMGFAALQTRALLSAEDTYMRTQAMALAQEILERKRINGSTEMFLDRALADPAVATYANAGNWTNAPGTNCFGTAVNCTPVQMAEYDIAQMLALANSDSYLPNGSVVVNQAAASNTIRVYVAWGDDTAADCATAGGLSGGLARRNCVVLQGM